MALLAEQPLIRLHKVTDDSGAEAVLDCGEFSMKVAKAMFGKTKFREVHADFNGHNDVLFQPNDSSARVLL